MRRWRFPGIGTWLALIASALGCARSARFDFDRIEDIERCKTTERELIAWAAGLTTSTNRPAPGDRDGDGMKTRTVC